MFDFIGLTVTHNRRAVNSIYNISYRSISGEEKSLAEFRGKKLLIVNTALQCGLTPQLRELEELYETFHSQGLEILAFPSNDFRQERNSNKAVEAVCRQSLGINFDLAEKIHVRGADKHELYRWLTSKKLNGKKSSFVIWNFQKYLVSREGEFQDWLFPWISPNSPQILNWINS